MSENTDRSKRSKQEKMFEDSTNIRSGGLPVSELVSWFRGPWTGRRIRRVIASLIGIYLFFVVITIWCPPVRGIVVDAQTGKRIAGVQVHLQSRGVSLLGVEAGNMVLWGKMLKTTTGADGRFSFRGNAARSRLDEGSFLDVFSPFQWITRVQLTVWAPGYGTRIISMPSYFFLPWWAETNVSRKWSANRLRIPVWGFRTKILIDKPSGEEEWRKQCDFTIFAKEEGFASDSWVFNDLTGYLQRWPQGKKAGEYMIEFSRFAFAVSKDSESYFRSGLARMSEQQLKRGIAADRLMERFLPVVKLDEIKKRNPLGYNDAIGRFLPDGFSKARKLAEELLEKKHKRRVP